MKTKTRRRLDALVDTALRLGVALSLAAFAWSVHEIARKTAAPRTIPALRSLQPAAPCAPPAAGARPAFASNV